ncbi:hypothetical protein [Spirosoma areae]
MTYAELDINQKIQTKAAIRAWLTYSIQHFQADLDKKVYGLRTTKKGVQRSSLGNYRFGTKKSRTNALRRTWYQSVSEGAGIDKVMIQFLLYGRFLDMGVGRGTSHTDRLVARQLKIGQVGRTRKPWYSKRKSYEIKRLREILAEQNIHLMLDSLETALSLSVHLNL